MSLRCRESMTGEEDNWSERVEDLADRGENETAISALESLVSRLEIQKASDSDQKLSGRIKKSEDCPINEASTATSSVSDDDDWEAIVDRGSVDIFSSKDEKSFSSNLSFQDQHQDIPSKDSKQYKSNLSQDTQIQAPKRRGRGAFLYKKDGLYSDRVDDTDFLSRGHSEGGDATLYLEDSLEVQEPRFGIDHVLVISDFPPSTGTTDLEKLFESFRERGLAIRWVNDTTALAVFHSSSLAREALKSIKCPYIVRMLSKDDSLLDSISKRNLEPPISRPKTSARTAQRLIAHAIGKEISSSFGFKELREQELQRRNRIVARQNMKNDAWGSDDP